MRVLVVGAGVVGLTCAVRLLEAGHRADVVARDLPLETTSAIAAALWYPYRALPEERVTAWSQVSYATFAELARDPATGVRMLSGTEVLAAPAPDPWWASAVPDLVLSERARTFTSPVIDMPVHLTWLHDQVLALGGTITRMNLSTLPADGLVVDATGLGARHFAADPTVRPERGQVVRVAQVGLDRWWLETGTDPTRPTYVVPRTHDIVLGGTDLADEWSRTPDPDVTADILARTTALVPELAGPGRLRVLGARVGLRPVRPEVRVERVGDVVHCYGHGGAGVTLGWGTAQEVVDLLS